MAKNKNQNRRQSEHQHDQRKQSGNDEHMTPGSPEVEERIMPATSHSSRKGQRKFGHN